MGSLGRIIDLFYSTPTWEEAPSQIKMYFKGHFIHETESPWPLHFKHSRWWKTRSWSKFTSHFPWGTNGVCECKMVVKSTWISTWHQMDRVLWWLRLLSKPPLGGGSNTKPGDHGTLNVHNCWFILFHHVWGPEWIDIHWHSIWLRARSHMASQYTWGSVTTLHDCGGVLGRPLHTFFWALKVSWSRVLARVWSGPKILWFRDFIWCWHVTRQFVKWENPSIHHSSIYME